jgi:hypothetical protein
MKKGSLELSINAIVILVMAMVVLGLGLGFIQNLIKKGEGNFVKVIDNNQLEVQPDANTPLVMDKQISIDSGNGKQATINIGFYNSDPTSLVVKLAGENKDSNPPELLCYGGAADAVKYKISGGELTANAKSALAMAAILTDINTGGAAAGQYSCTVQIVNAGTVKASQQFFLQVIG